jgi:exopolysaccharide biosynthesis polyprenyl glycosylphosphotransferase
VRLLLTIRQRDAATSVPVPIPTRRRPRDYTLRRALAAADTVAVTAALAAATVPFGDDARPAGKLVWGLLTLPAWVVLLKLYGLYERDAKRVSHSTVDDLPWLFHVLVVGSAGLYLFFQVALEGPLALREALVFFAVSLPALFLARAAARALVRRSIPRERVLLVGGGPMARVLVDKMRMHDEYGLDPVGYIDSDEPGTESLERALPYLGALEDVERVCREAEVDRIVALSPAIDQDALAEVIRRTSDLRISILPNLVDVLGPSIEIDDLEGVTVLGINPPALTRSSRFLKRAMDVTFAAAVLALFLPVMAVIAVAVKVTSPGSVLYSQERIGRNGRRFRLHKFRTMVADADEQAEALRDQSAHPVWLLLERDPRVTPLGRWLRRTSLDELPQLWNVLKGEMSLVGPRPMPPDVDRQISGWGRRRLDLTPGITGLWQVLGRVNIPFEEMVKLDYLYVTNWSLWQDVRLLIHTLPSVLRRRGAN